MKTRLAVYKGLGGFGTLGLEIVLSILFGLFGGRWLDGRFGTEPWLMWICFGLGLVASVNAILRALKAMRAEAAREEAAEGNPAPLYETDADRRVRVDNEREGALRTRASDPGPKEDAT